MTGQGVITIIHETCISSFSFSTQTKELPTFKDQDFVDGGHMILIGKEAKENFMQKIEADVNVRNATTNSH